jgi:protein-S-isoprenylcysteine O-methyltransferase Ste14
MVGSLGLRAWAFAHLGGQGRTRDPRAPEGRVASGPYAHLDHPVYLANLLAAAGLILAVAPPPAFAGVALVLTVALYAVLAARESAQVRGLPVVLRPRRTVAQVARSERSTWLTVGVLLVLAAC